MQATLGSLFDGIGGWPLAAVKNGIKPLWASEIEPFPQAVTAHWFPDMKQLGDITKLNGKPATDTARYKALGNGMAQPCADFVIEGIARTLEGA